MRHVVGTSPRDPGFSLVELLTVVVILGIMAAIAVPTYLNQREKAYRAAVASDLRSVVLAQSSRAVDGDPMYTTDLAELRTQGYTNSDGVSPAHIVLFDGDEQYVACVKHESLPDWLVYSSVDGVTAYSPVQCAAPPP